MIICRAQGDKDVHFPLFYLSGEELCVCSEARYLRHFRTHQMSDHDDSRTLYAQDKMLARKCPKCSDYVKIEYVSLEHIALSYIPLSSINLCTSGCLK